MQQALTAYLLPCAFTSLLHGPLSDALGRRPVVLWGIGVYTLASLACMFAPSYGALLVFRAAQGMTAGVGMAVGRAVIRDRFEGADAQRLMSAVTMVFSAAPALAPIAGGWIHVWFGWRAVFGFLTLLGAALWLAVFRLLDESHPPARRTPLHAATLARISWQIVSDRRFLPVAISAGLSFASVMLFVGSAPAIVLDHWQLRETQFGWLFVAIVLGFIGGAGLSGRVAGRWSTRRQVLTGFMLSIGAASAAALLQAFVVATPIVLQQLCLCFMAFGVQLSFPPLTLRLLDLFPQSRGSVSSVQSFVALLIGGTTMGLIAPTLAHSMLWLSLGSIATTLTAFSLWGISSGWK